MYRNINIITICWLYLIKLYLIILNVNVIVLQMLMTIKRKTSLWLIILESLFKNSFKIGLQYTHILNKGNVISLKFPWWIPINTGYHKENFLKL